MTDGKINLTFWRGATTDSVIKDGPCDSELLNHDVAFPRKIRKLVSMDSGKAEVVKKSLGASTESFTRHSVRFVVTSKHARRFDALVHIRHTVRHLLYALPWRNVVYFVEEQYIGGVPGRTSKRLRRQEPDFGHDTVTYEEIRERVLQELAVTNAIDALHERWEMIMFMYDDCVELNELKRGRKLRKLCIKRQFELIMIISVFLLICFPISVLFVLVNS